MTQLSVGPYAGNISIPGRRTELPPIRRLAGAAAAAV